MRMEDFWLKLRDGGDREALKRKRIVE